MTRFDVFAAILRDIGTPMTGRVLDLGCGDGALVKGALDNGLDAYGCDMEVGSFIKTSSVLNEMAATGRLRPIESKPYRLPFEDEFFDVVVSDQVLEHVLNHSETLGEVARVMKPGAYCLHMFPARARLLEGHLFIPFGGVFRPRWWLAIWAYLGVRNQFQRGKSAKEVLEENIKWFPVFTNYPPFAQMRACFEEYFQRVESVERHFLRYSNRARMLRFAPALYRLFGSHVVYAQK